MKRFIAAATAGFAGLIILTSIGLPAADEGSLPAMEVTEDAAVERKRREARGAYLAKIGNCMGCHTTPAGKPYAGGHHLDTPIGTFITPNITPDQETGIGLWSEDDFWRALHEGKRRDGSAL